MTWNLKRKERDESLFFLILTWEQGVGEATVISQRPHKALAGFPSDMTDPGKR